MALFTPQELEILKKFRKRSDITSKEETKVVEKWRIVGFFSIGFNWETGRPTAKLTPLGLSHLNKCIKEKLLFKVVGIIIGLVLLGSLFVLLLLWR